FGGKNTLVVYNYMFGPQREKPCPMCTSLLSAWDGEVPDITQRVALAVVARSPIERLVAFKRQRGWHYLPLFADTSGEFSRDYHALTKDGGDDAAFNVFTRHDGVIRHFWGGEMNGASADPGQDPRGAPDLTPNWPSLDLTLAAMMAQTAPKARTRSAVSNAPAWLTCQMQPPARMATVAAPICGRKSCAPPRPPVRASVKLVPAQNMAASTWSEITAIDMGCMRELRCA